MKFKNIKYTLLLAVGAMVFSGCETLPDQKVEYTPTFAVSGEWVVHVKNNATGVYFGQTAARPLGTGFSMRTYNTSENVSNKIWVRLGTAAQAVAILGKADCDVNQRTISGAGIANATKGGTFTINEGKVLIGSTKLHSGIMGDSIHVNYTTTFDGNTYIVEGHRRSAWNEDEY